MRAPRPGRLRLALIACAALAALPSAASAKPKVAVLGLEVVDTGGGAVDSRTTGAARALTKELRQEAAGDVGKFELAPDSAKDLLELKLLSDCSDEGRRCMADIGKELKADFLLYGKIEKQKQGYQVSLKLLDTATGQMAKTTTDIVPFGDVNERGLARWSHAFYARLTGAPEAGTLVVQANVDGGMVYVDGELRTNLADGTARITDLSAGVHRVTIQSDGYTRHDSEVEIAAGEEEELVATLIAEADDGGGGGDEGRPGEGWRTATWVGAGVLAVSTSVWLYEAHKYSGFWGLTEAPLKRDHLRAVERLDDELVAAGEAPLPEGDACALAVQHEDRGGGIGSAATGVGKACDRGTLHANATTVLGIATALTAVATGYFYYKGYVAPGGSSTEREARRRRAPRQPMVRFVPAISPTGVGAGIALEF